MDNKRDQDKELIEKALAAAKRLGVNAQIERWEPDVNGGRVDAEILLQLAGKKVRYAVEVKRGLRPATLGAVIQQLRQLGGKILLIADYVAPQLADALRGHGVAFLDTVGNAFIDQPPMLVWVKGERPIAPATLHTTGRAFLIWIKPVVKSHLKIRGSLHIGPYQKKEGAALSQKIEKIAVVPPIDSTFLST